MKLLANHRSDAFVHERQGGTFIVPQVDPAGGPAVLRVQELLPDQSRHVAEAWGGLVKRSTNLTGCNPSGQREASNNGNRVIHGTIDRTGNEWSKWN